MTTKLVLLSALALLAASVRPTFADDKVKMTDDEKIQWYCAQHPDEGANCAAHARLLLPYISDYAKYPDTDVRGQTIDNNLCDFSPLPPGCPGATSGGGLDTSNTDDGSDDSGQAGGGGRAISGPGVGVGVPLIPIKGGNADGGPAQGTGSGGGACGSDYVKSENTLPKDPADFCADQAGVRFSVVKLPLPPDAYMHFNPSTAFALEMTADKDGTYSRCWETDSPAAGSSKGCMVEMWFSLKPGGALLGKDCGGMQPINEGGSLMVASGGPLPKYGISCAVAPGTKFYCNIAIPTEVWGQSGKDCNALLLTTSGYWH